MSAFSRHSPYSSSSPVRAEEVLHLPKPDACPVCRSSAVQTTSKSPDSESYWRCTACGEVWNPGRAARSFRAYR